MWIATQPVDFRKGVAGLAALAAQALQIGPYGGDIVVFRSKRSDRIKLLAWNGTGIVLATKWLEGGRFAWPPVRGDVINMSATQLALLLDGLAWSHAVTPIVKKPILAA